MSSFDVSYRLRVRTQILFLFHFFVFMGIYAREIDDGLERNLKLIHRRTTFFIFDIKILQKTKLVQFAVLY